MIVTSRSVKWSLYKGGEVVVTYRSVKWAYYKGEECLLYKGDK